VVLEARKRSLVVNLRATALNRPVVRIFAVQMRRSAAEKVHRHRNHAREMECDAAARSRLVQRFARQRAEILEQETMAARGQYPAADLVARQLLALEDDGLESGVDQAFGGGGGGKARADDDDVSRAHVECPASCSQC